MIRRRLSKAASLLLLALGALGAPAVNGEQMRRFGDWQVHYVVVPSGFLKADIAARHDIIRGRDRAFLNISVLDAAGDASRVDIRGHSINLLGQQYELGFREVLEGNAVYYLADFRFSNEEVLRFKIRITAPGSSEMLLEFQQQLYWEEP